MADSTNGAIANAVGTTPDGGGGGTAPEESEEGGHRRLLRKLSLERGLLWRGEGAAPERTASEKSLLGHGAASTGYDRQNPRGYDRQNPRGFEGRTASEKALLGHGGPWGISHSGIMPQEGGSTEPLEHAPANATEDPGE